VEAWQLLLAPGSKHLTPVQALPPLQKEFHIRFDLREEVWEESCTPQTE
jgi:hypothetical protein